MIHLVLFELFVTNLIYHCLSTKKKNCSLDEFSGPYGITIRQWLKEGCRKPVLGVCLLSCFKQCVLGLSGLLGLNAAIILPFPLLQCNYCLGMFLFFFSFFFFFS